MEALGITKQEQNFLAYKAKMLAMISDIVIDDLVFADNGAVTFIKNGHKCIYTHAQFAQFLNLKHDWQSNLNYTQKEFVVEEEKQASKSLRSTVKVIRF